MPTEAGGVDRRSGGRPAQWLRERSQGEREARQLTPVAAPLALAARRVLVTNVWLSQAPAFDPMPVCASR